MLEEKTIHPRPPIIELGSDLLDLTATKLFLTLTLPFFFFALYFWFAANDIWIGAVLCTMAVSFTTYGSTSHDLVHQNLKINKTLNEALLTFIELICFRSGHSYKISHLYHHKRYPHKDDVEGAASRMTFLATLLEGVVFQFKIYKWSLKNYKTKKELHIIIAEGIAVLFLSLLCIFSLRYSIIGFVYFCLMIMGSWIIPLITSYAVHTPDGESELYQTRLFRGKFFSLIAFDHLYHLEHHLYPMVPHKNWPELARRLNPYFEKNRIVPLEVLKSKKTYGQKNTS